MTKDLSDKLGIKTLHGDAYMLCREGVDGILPGAFKLSGDEAKEMFLSTLRQMHGDDVKIAIEDEILDLTDRLFIYREGQDYFAGIVEEFLEDDCNSIKTVSRCEALDLTGTISHKTQSAKIKLVELVSIDAAGQLLSTIKKSAGAKFILYSPHSYETVPRQVVFSEDPEMGNKQGLQEVPDADKVFEETGKYPYISKQIYLGQLSTDERKQISESYNQN